MIWNPFQRLFPPKKILGIDIGTSCIKLVEISQSGNRQKLENYGFLPVTAFGKESFQTFEKNSLSLFTKDIAKAINIIIQETGIESRQAVFSIPDFATFFTSFELPLMTKKELGQAIQYEARQHIPLPLKEIFLNWQITKGTLLKEKEINISQKKKLKILLVATSNKIIKQYQEIVAISQLELISLEAEAFSLIRALVKKNEKNPVALIDIGARSTACNIINKTKLENSYSFNVSSGEFDKKIAEKFNINYSEAEKLKKKHGLSGDLRQILLPLIDIIIIEIEKTFNSFEQKERVDIQKIILAGGTALLPGLREYLQIKLKKEVIISHPFSTLDYPSVLEKTLKEKGPSCAVAVGVALRKYI